MKLLVVGISGFMGRNVLEYAPKDVEITGVYNRSEDIVAFAKKVRKNTILVQCDLTEFSQIKNVAKKIGTSFDCCLYFAGNVDVPLSKKDPVQDLRLNVIALINLLQNISIKRFVLLSTAGVYDGLSRKITGKDALNPTVPYCLSKLMAEQYVKYFQSIGKIDEYAILRFGGAFGKHSKREKFASKVIQELGVENKNTIEVYGDGRNIINIKKF